MNFKPLGEFPPAGSSVATSLPPAWIYSLEGLVWEKLTGTGGAGKVGAGEPAPGGAAG
ncbi:MAG: hypothetical protein ABW208_22250 [Pyrinomonadaceae bacterium]